MTRTFPWGALRAFAMDLRPAEPWDEMDAAAAFEEFMRPEREARKAEDDVIEAIRAGMEGMAKADPLTNRGGE